MAGRVRRPALLLALAGLVALAAPAVPGGGSTAQASEPGSSSLTAPTSAGSSPVETWTGSIPPGPNPNSDCSTLPASQSDPHKIAITVPTGAYENLEATLTVSITFKSSVNDEILTLLGPDGKAVGSSDTSDATETVSLLDPKPGTYTALACGFITTSQAYDGRAQIVSKARSTASSLPLVDPQGLQFSATVPSDPQRDEGEPAVTTDRDGTIYTCGPTGFSTANDYAQASTDGGDQFHLLGTPPRGQLGLVEAGGDCALAAGITKNADKNYTLAYTGLGPLTNFSTATSSNRGRTLAQSFFSQSVPGVDRQWLAFGSDANTSYLTYNSELLNKVVQKSTNGGLTYGATIQAANEAGRIGQIRVIPKSVTGTGKDFVYLPYSVGTTVKIALSQDGGDTFSQCVAVDAKVDPTAGFVTADNDNAGNVYVTYTEKGAGRDTYLVSIPFGKFKDCKGATPLSPAANNVTNPGFSPKLRLNRGGVETTVMPWVAASGEPGKVAVSYYGTKQIGDPNDGKFKASWNVYVSQVLDALAPSRHVAQVQASTHPNHYDSICLNGLGCDVSGGDRSLVDYFTMEYNRGTKGLNIVYSQAGKRPGDAAGVVATPAVVTQIAGPSNGGGTVSRTGREVVRSTSPDPAGDAISNYSVATPLKALPVPPRAAEVPALDLVSRDGKPAVQISPRNGGGMTVTLRYKDLSDAALTSALTSTTAGTPGSLVYIYRFFNGYRSAAAVAKYDGFRGFTFGFNGYSTASAPCLGTDAKCLVYPGTDKPLVGKVDKKAGTITLSVPLSYLTALGSGLSQGKPYPGEVPAKAGSRLYDATAFSFINDVPFPELQTFMQQVDNAPAMDLQIPAAAAGTGPPKGNGPPPKGNGPPSGGGPNGGSSGGTTNNASGGSLATTGLPLALPALALVLLGGAALLRRRRIG